MDGTAGEARGSHNAARENAKLARRRLLLLWLLFVPWLARSGGLRLRRPASEKLSSRRAHVCCAAALTADQGGN